MYLSSPVGGDSAHVVVDCGDDGDGLAGDVDAGEDHGRLGDSGQTLGQLLWGQVVQLEEAVVWSPTQFHSVDFSLSRIRVKKCVFHKCPIKVCVSCF